MPKSFFYFGYKFYLFIKLFIKYFIKVIKIREQMANYYLKAYKILIEPRRKFYKSEDKFEPNFDKNVITEIKKALLRFLKLLKKLISSSKLKYSDLSPFVVLDKKFLFAKDKIYRTLNNYGPTLEITTKGLLYELMKSLDLEKYNNLILELEEKLSNLHESLSLNRTEGIEKNRKKVLEAISKMEEIIKQIK